MTMNNSRSPNTQINEHQIRKRLPAKRERVTWMRTKFGIKRPAWCVLHNDFAWIWGDGSEGCWYDCVTESSNEHDIVPIAVELPPRALGTEDV